MVVGVAPHNLDLQITRRSLGLRQSDLARMLGLTRHAAISEFETDDEKLPNNITRRDVERTLERAARVMKKLRIQKLDRHTRDQFFDHLETERERGAA